MCGDFPPPHKLESGKRDMMISQKHVLGEAESSYPRRNEYPPLQKLIIGPFFCDFPPSILSPNRPFSWPRVSAKADYRILLRTLTQQAMRKSKVSQADIQALKKTWRKNDRITINITYTRPNNRWGSDHDNVEAAFKPGQDGIADALGIDDRYIRRIQTHSDEPDAKKKGHVEIIITIPKGM
jgi:lambda repressor-like predicted transcriptional regulator